MLRAAPAEQSATGQRNITALQILSLHERREPVRHAQFLRTHIFDMADMDWLQVQKPHVGPGSPADILRLVADIFSQHLPL